MYTHPYAPVDVVDGVLTVRWAISKKLDASDSILWHGASPFENLMGLLTSAQQDESVQVIVLRNDDSSRVEGFQSNAIAEMVSQLASHLSQMPQPIVAMVLGEVLEEAMPIWQACDIVFASHEDNPGKDVEGVKPNSQPRSNWATLYFPFAELEAQTYKLANELAAKDPLALRFTKKTVQQVAAVPWDAILNFTTSQQAEIKSLQAGRPSARALAIESFLAGKSKPGAGT